MYWSFSVSSASAPANYWRKIHHRLRHRIHCQMITFNSHYRDWMTGMKGQIHEGQPFNFRFWEYMGTLFVLLSPTWSYVSISFHRSRFFSRCVIHRSYNGSPWSELSFFSYLSWCFKKWMHYLYGQMTVTVIGCQGFSPMIDELTCCVRNMVRFWGCSVSCCEESSHGIEHDDLDSVFNQRFCGGKSIRNTCYRTMAWFGLAQAPTVHVTRSLVRI